MSRGLGAALKFGVFVTVMLALTAGLFAVFGDYRGGSTAPYSAVFTDVSDLRTGDSVRVAGLRVGTVKTVALRPDKKVVVDFDTDRTVKLTAGTRAAVRYLNLVGDRYLEIIDGPGSTRIMPPGSQIQMDHTMPALDLDVLLNGLKPVVQGLNPQDVNTLTTSLIQIMQGQGGTMESLLSRTSSFTNALADNGQVLEQLIDNLNAAMATAGRRRRQIQRSHRPTSPPRQRASGRARSHRRGDRLAEQGHCVVGQSAGRVSSAARCYRQPAQPPRTVAGCRQGPHRRRAPKGPGGLPETGADGRLRQLLQLLPMRRHAQGERPTGPHRCLPVDQTRNREVRREPMNKYRGKKLIRSGFIGAVLIV